MKKQKVTAGVIAALVERVTGMTGYFRDEEQKAVTFAYSGGEMQRPVI